MLSNNDVKPPVNFFSQWMWNSCLVTVRLLLELSIIDDCSFSLFCFKILNFQMEIIGKADFGRAWLVLSRVDSAR